MARAGHFFTSKNPQAVLKHGILTRYAHYFAGRAGRATGGRVLLIDGYAGSGRYDDGSPGSPLLLAEQAERAKDFGRSVKLELVERDPAIRARLVDTLAASGVDATPIDGSFQDVVPLLLDRYADHAVLVFVDPFGLAVTYDCLVDILRRSTPRQPIDVLYHFSLSTVARMGPAGVNEDPAVVAANAPQLDAAFGPVDWRTAFRTGSLRGRIATRTAVDVAHALGEHLQATTSTRSTSIPVRQRPDQLPKYLLTLLSREPSGKAHWDFASLAAKAHVEWLHYCDTADYDAYMALNDQAGVLELFPPPRPDLDVIAKKHGAVVDRVLAPRLTRLLQERRTMRLLDDIEVTYGETLGIAGEPDVRRVIKQLHGRGLIDDDGVGDFYTRTITWTGP